MESPKCEGPCELLGRSQSQFGNDCCVVTHRGRLLTPSSHAPNHNSPGHCLDQLDVSLAASEIIKTGALTVRCQDDRSCQGSEESLAVISSGWCFVLDSGFILTLLASESVAPEWCTVLDSDWQVTRGLWSGQLHMFHNSSWRLLRSYLSCYYSRLYLGSEGRSWQILYSCSPRNRLLIIACFRGNAFDAHPS